MSIDLTDFEQRVTLRNVKPEDFDQIVALQLACFPTMKPWTRAQLESQIRIFPEGQVCIEIDGQVIASAASLVIDDANYYDWQDWLKISDNGYIRNHDPEGNTLYGIEIQVHPDLRGRRLARRLYDARKELCRRLNLEKMVIGGRIPGYSGHQEEMTAREYVDAVMNKRFHDPVLTAQLANGFVLKRLIPDYFPSDEDSAGYATYLEWTNLDYAVTTTRHRRRVEPVRVAAVQYEMRAISSFDDFARQCEFFVDTAADAHADFVLFPELFTLQLLSLVESGRPGEAARQLAEFLPQYLELFTGLAIRYNVNIVGGSLFIVEEDRLLNVCYLFRRDGTLARQEKLHVTPNERYWWGVEGGTDFDVHQTDCGPIAIMVCYDCEFPELARRAADRGAQLLFVPYNTNDRYGHLRVRICAHARCIENHLYVVTAGCVGNLPFVENADIHYAQSAILTPADVSFARDGIAAEASPNLETVLVHDVDLELTRRHKKTGGVQNWNDRRTDLYDVQWKGGS